MNISELQQYPISFQVVLVPYFFNNIVQRDQEFDYVEIGDTPIFQFERLLLLIIF